MTSTIAFAVAALLSVATPTSVHKTRQESQVTVATSCNSSKESRGVAHNGVSQVSRMCYAGNEAQTWKSNRRFSAVGK